RPAAVVDQGVAVAGVVERRPVAVRGVHAELPELRRLGAQREPVRVVVLQVVNERGEQDGLAGVVKPNHPDACLGRFQPEGAHGLPWDMMGHGAATPQVASLRTLYGTDHMSAIRFTHLDHCSVIITDLARARAFYSGVLGLKEIAKPRTFDFV